MCYDQVSIILFERNVVQIFSYCYLQAFTSSALCFILHFDDNFGIKRNVGTTNDDIFFRLSKVFKNGKFLD
jgi:hypothetical protein